MLSDNSGESGISTLVYLLVVVIIIYGVVKVVPPYMHYYSMDDEVYQQLKMSRINPPEVIKQDLFLKARELELPVGEEGIVLSYDEDGRLKIFVSWKEEVDFGYGLKKEFEYVIDTSSGVR